MNRAPGNHCRWFPRLAAALLLFGCVCAAHPAPAFEEANRLYERGDYPAAARAYEEVLATGDLSAPIYYNWGNALFRSGQRGRAVAAYRHALKLSPRDPDIRANLRFVRSQVAAEGDPGSRRSHSQPEWIERFTLNEWTAMAGGALLAWFLLLTLRQCSDRWKSALRGWTAAGGAMALALCALAGAAVHREYFVSEAVVIVPDTGVRRGPLDESQVVTALPDGAEATVIGTRENWLQIRTQAGETGWIPAANALRFIPGTQSPSPERPAGPPPSSP